MAGVRVLCSLVAFVLGFSLDTAHAEDSAPRLAAYPEGVRFDLETRRFLPAGRPDGPQESEDFLLPTPLRFRALRDEVVAFFVLASGAPGPHRVAVDPLTSKTSSVSAVQPVVQP